MTPAKVLDRLGPAYTRLVHTEGPACILATAIGVDTLREFGIEARPLSVMVDLVNPAWLKWHQDGQVGGADGLLASGAWQLSTGHPEDVAANFQPPTVQVSKPWDGHLVIELASSRASILDLDLGAMRRPAKGIHVPPVGWFSGWNGTAGEWPLPGGCRIRYEAKRQDVASWGGARDWWDRDKRAATVAALVRAIRKGR